MKEAEDFLAVNNPNYENHRHEIPMSTISRIERGKKTLWENPMYKKN